MKRFVMRRFVTVLCASGLIVVSTQASASGFQLWEQDGASVGNYHAGYAAEANDASVAWYNPAGIPRIQNQQVVIGASAILSDFKYKGSVGVSERTPLVIFNPGPSITFPVVTNTFNNVTAQGGTFNVVPNLHYVAPISDWIGFGFSIDVPFGLKTSYGSSTPLKYAATLTSIRVVDISPSLGFKITDKASLGVGFDIQRAYAEFNSVAALINPQFLPPIPPPPKVVLPAFDTDSTNKANDTGYGFRLGFLYEFTPCTRVGLSYHSQVVHHFSGTSRFEGPINEIVNQGQSIVSSRATTNVKLPPYTALSVFNKISPNWALMGTLIYTQWNTFKTLSLNQVAGVVDTGTIPAPSTNIDVEIPENYHNTWNLSLGANYYPTDTIILRGGIGFDQSPVRNKYRNVQLPDGDRYALALGGHFQATKTIGLDVGWSHIFFSQVKVNPPPQVNGAETVSTNGHVKGSADVLSGQVTWDII